MPSVLSGAGHAIFSEVRVTVYTTEPCGYCRTAKALLAKRGIPYEEINLAKDADGRSELAERTGMMTFPQVIIDGEPARRLPGARRGRPRRRAHATSRPAAEGRALGAGWQVSQT